MDRRFVSTVLAVLALVSLRAGQPAGARPSMQVFQRWYGAHGRTAVPGASIPFEIQTRDATSLSLDV